MALTPSTMLPLGTTAPEFSLPDVTTGKTVALGELGDSEALLVMFICNHCPFVKHIAAGLAALAKDYADESVALIGISSNDAATYSEDSPERMEENAAAQGWAFPYLFDETQEVARAYRAACTPDFFLFDGSRKLVYRGQLDDSRPDNSVPVTGEDLRAAIDAVLSGEKPAGTQKPSIGCNIKWKAGNEPEYFG